MDDRTQGGENNSPNRQGGGNNSPDRPDRNRENDTPDAEPGKSVPPQE